MKNLKNNIQKLENGYIGTIIEKRFGMTNLLNNCTKDGNIISVEGKEDQGATRHAIEDFCKIYAGKKLTMLF